VIDIVAQYVLQPGNHKIVIPQSSYSCPRDIHRFLLGMSSSLCELLSIHDNSRNEDPELILEAFEDWLNEVSPRFTPLRRFEIYSTYTNKCWFFSMWIIHRLKWFVEDKGQLVSRIVEVRKRIQREAARTAEAAKYWDEEDRVDSFSGVHGEIDRTSQGPCPEAEYDNSSISL
jgi:hypothetical protein